MSTFNVEVVPVVMTPHPNADTLSLVEIFGFTAIVRTADWVGVDHGAYVPVDGVVPDTAEFAFLDGVRRIKARRLRGIFSMGLLVAPRPHWKIGDDVTAELGIEKYEPDLFKDLPVNNEDGDAPDGIAPCYTDLEALRRHLSVFVPGEEVVVTEKIHGANARYTLRPDRLHIGSRTRWKKPDGNTIWHRAAPSVEKLACLVDGAVLYGEVYGQVQDLRYGTKAGEVRFRAFDMFNPSLDGGRYVDHSALGFALGVAKIEQAPILYRGPLDFEKLQALAEEDSTVDGAGGIREGIVVRPVHERYDHRIGRVIAKLHSQRYLLRKGG